MAPVNLGMRPCVNVGVNRSLVAAAGDIREQPEHWINVLNIEPSVENLQTLSVLLRQKPVVWVRAFPRHTTHLPA